MAWSGGHGKGSQLLPISRRTLALYLLLFLFPIPLDYLKKLLLLIICFFQRRGLLLPVTAVLSCASLFPTCFDFFLLLIAGPFCPSVRLKAEKWGEWIQASCDPDKPEQQYYQNTEEILTSYLKHLLTQCLTLKSGEEINLARCNSTWWGESLPAAMSTSSRVCSMDTIRGKVSAWNRSVPHRQEVVRLNCSVVAQGQP